MLRLSVFLLLPLLFLPWATAQNARQKKQAEPAREASATPVDQLKVLKDFRVELLRDGYLGPVVRTHYSVSYLAGACLVLTAFGLVQERVVSKTLTLG